ncbi:hypothetical protein MTO96_003012 [Rhipicephalus appendiculatus]
MGTPVKSALLRPGVVPSIFVNEQSPSEAPRAACSKRPKHEILIRLLPGSTAILLTPKPSHCSERDHDYFASEPIHEAAPGLAYELGQAVETSPEPACESNHVTDKSVQVQILTRHEASQANEKKILSTTATQTEPHAFSSDSNSVAPWKHSHPTHAETKSLQRKRSR